jgi:hypothetical protein
MEKLEKNLAIPLEGNEKKEICHRNLKRKNLKIFIFEPEMKISV